MTEKKRNKHSRVDTGLALGLALGVGFGAVLGNIATGVAVGLVLGLSWDSSNRCADQDDAE